MTFSLLFNDKSEQYVRFASLKLRKLPQFFDFCANKC